MQHIKAKQGQGSPSSLIYVDRRAACHYRDEIALHYYPMPNWDAGSGGRGCGCNCVCGGAARHASRATTTTAVELIPRNFLTPRMVTLQ